MTVSDAYLGNPASPARWTSQATRRAAPARGSSHPRGRRAAGESPSRRGSLRSAGLAAVALAAVLVADLAGAPEAGTGLLDNGSFAEGLTNWQPTASRPGLRVEVVSATVPRAPDGGVGALRISGRRWRTEMLGQDLASSPRDQ